MKFSLAIPVAPYRDAEILESVNKLDFPKKDFEILIEEGLSASTNRNRCFERSKGKILAFLDDDGVIEPDLLKNAERFFEEHPEIDIVGGPQLTPKDEKGFAKISGYALSSKFGGWNASNRYGKKKLNLDADDTYLTTAIMFCRREVMDKVKFDPNLWPGEDSKFVAEAKAKGFKVAYSPELIIYHRRRPTLKAFVKQIFNYGRVGPIREKFSETIKRPFFLIPSGFFIYLVLLPTGYLLNEIFWKNQIFHYALFAPLVAYGILNILFSLYESLKNKDLRGILFLPFIFLILHLSYGAGWLYSYMKKLFKN